MSARSRFRFLRACACAGLAAWSLARAFSAEPGARSIFAPEAGRPYLRTFLPDDYEAHNQVWSMAEDAAGIVYVGAFGNLLEYDGTAWRRTKMDGSVRNLGFTPDGRLWLTSNDDFGWCDRDETGTLRFHSLRAALPPEAGRIGALPTFAIVGHDIWITTTKGIVRWRDRVPRFWPLAEGPVWALYPLDDRLWLRQTGATKFAELRGEELVQVLDDPAVAKRPLNFILRAADGALIFGVNQSGLWRLQEGKLVPWETPAAAVLAKARLYAGARLSDGAIAVGTLNEGLFLISADGRAARQLRLADGLPSDLIEGLGQDRAGRLWVCTYHGLAVIEWPASLSLFDRRAGFDPAVVQTMSRQNGRMLFGGFGGIQTLAPAAPERLAPATIERTPGATLITSETLHHPRGILYPGPGGIKYLTANAEDYAIKLEDNLLALGQSRHEPDRVFFVGANRFGAVRFCDGAWRLEGYHPKLTGIPRELTMDADGAVWLRNYDNTLTRLAPDAPGPIDWSRMTATPAATLPGWPGGDPMATRLGGTPHGPVFFSGRAVYRFDGASGGFVPEPRVDLAGMPAGETQPISAGEELWCTVFSEGEVIGRRHAFGRFVFGADGIGRWRPAPANYATIFGGLGVSQAFQDREQPGVVWLQSANAIGRLELEHMPETRPPLAPLIRRVRAGAQALPLAAAALTLPWSRAQMAFEFAAPGRNEARFRTRLIGWDETWSAPTARGAAEFVGLAPGRYVFEVIEQPPHGAAGAPARFAFAILPPWWRSTGAFVGYAALGLGAMAGVLRWRLSRAAREQRRLEGLVAERTRDLAAARDQAETANRAKSAFLASMSHELRTPLNGVIGYAQVLQNDRRLLADQQERVRIVHQSGEHLLRMINDVLDLAKIEAGKLELRVAPLALGDLLREVAAAHAPAAAERRLAFSLEAAPGLPAWVAGDAAKLRQVLDNLIGNAIKFTPAGSVCLRVRAYPALNAAPHALEFAVSDTGPGIAAADQTRLFQPFEQARATHAGVAGTGLGLAISRALVERMGGTLTLESAVGAGSTFTVRLTLPEAGPTLSPATEPVPVTGYAGPRRRVLIVDDHPVNRALLADLLGPLGFACAAYESAPAVLGALERNETPWPDLVILDLRMEGVDGLELTRRLRARADGRALRVLLTSASVLTFNPADGRAAGCDDFLPKPFRTADLVEKIGALLALTWQHAAPAEAAPAHPGRDGGVSLPAMLRASLQEALASGDIEEVRRRIAAGRVACPEAEPIWRQLDEAAAGFQLSRLRQILERA